jgi:hypothetical protein
VFSEELFPRVEGVEVFILGAGASHRAGAFGSGQEIRGEPLAKLQELADDEDVQQAAEEEFDEVVAE